MRAKHSDHRGRWKILLSICLFAIALSCAATIANPLPKAPALPMGWKKGRETGLPIPRFVSLKARNARMRVGPSFDYAAKWVYVAPGLPMEIIEEYGNWRQVRDCDGISGWMHRSLLSRQRTAMIGPWEKTDIPLYSSANSRSQVKARLEARVRMSIKSCRNQWCFVAVHNQSTSGYVEQSDLWGVYPAELVN